jgi:hypothetical protein
VRLKEKPLLDIVSEDVLLPLGITPSNRTKDAEQPDIYASRHQWNRAEKRWEAEPDNYTEPDSMFGAISSLSLTSADMLRLGEALLAHAPAHAEAVISPWVKERLFSKVVQVPREISPFRTTRWNLGGFGLGMATFRDGHLGCMTTGRGQNSSITFDKDRHSVLALAMNTINVLERQAVLNLLFAKFAKDASIVPESRTLDIGFDEFIQPFTTRDIGGVYLGFASEPIEIFATPNSFTLHVRKKEQYRFEATPENRLVMHAKMSVPVGLFQDPGSRRPCVTLGMHPFKKVG